MKTKLIDNIQVNLTNRRKARQFPIAKYSYSETHQKDFGFERGTELVVKIELGATQFISDELLNITGSTIIDQVKRQIGRSITNMFTVMYNQNCLTLLTKCAKMDIIG